MNGEQLGVTPQIHFAGSALTLSGLAKILSMLNESGQINVRGIATGSVNLLELGSALSELKRSAFVLAGARPRERVQSEVGLWIRRNGVPVYRTSYRHKLLRHAVIIETPAFEDIGLPRGDANYGLHR
jgi:hypothetical protein